MTFEEILDQAIAMLQRRGRLTYGTLKRQFQLDDAAEVGGVTRATSPSTHHSSWPMAATSLRTPLAAGGAIFASERRSFWLTPPVW
jgi:hypothetical protein